jgi:transposase
LLKIPAVGRKYANLIEVWQKRSHFGVEVEWVSEMIQEDAQRSLDLEEKIKALETKIKQVAKDSKIAKILLSIPGFGPVSTSELVGEIGNIERFSKEGSLALCLGMSTLDNSELRLAKANLACPSLLFLWKPLKCVEPHPRRWPSHWTASRTLETVKSVLVLSPSS